MVVVKRHSKRAVWGVKPFVVAITGGTASGKGTFAKMLAERFPGKTTVVSMDMYYKDQEHLPLKERFASNMDRPEAFDTELLISHMRDLSEGKSIKSPIYDFATHERSAQSAELPARGWSASGRKAPTSPVGRQNLIIVEGLLTLHNPKLLALYDLKIYLEADADLRLARRLLRDLKEKRYETPEESIKQYLTSARPNHKIYIAPQKEKADLVVDWNEINSEALDRVAEVIEGKLPQTSSTDQHG